MAETDFILMSEEQDELASFLLDQGIVFVPCMRYHTRGYKALKRLKDVSELYSSDDVIGPFLLLSDRLTTCPPELRLSQWRGRNWYTINSRHGGPYIDLLPCREQTEGVRREKEIEPSTAIED